MTEDRLPLVVPLPLEVVSKYVDGGFPILDEIEVNHSRALKSAASTYPTRRELTSAPAVFEEFVTEELQEKGNAATPRRSSVTVPLGDLGGAEKFQLSLMRSEMNGQSFLQCNYVYVKNFKCLVRVKWSLNRDATTEAAARASSADDDMTLIWNTVVETGALKKNLKLMLEQRKNDADTPGLLKTLNFGGKLALFHEPTATVVTPGGFGGCLVLPGDTYQLIRHVQI